MNTQQRCPNFETKIKAAARHAVLLSGGCAKVARTLGWSESLVSEYCSDDYSNRFPPIHFCFALDKMAGAPVCLTAYAEQLGYKIERVSAPDPVLAIEALGQLSEAVGDLSVCTSRAAADGRFSINELRAIDKHQLTVSESLRQFDAMVAK